MFYNSTTSLEQHGPHFWVGKSFSLNHGGQCPSLSYSGCVVKVGVGGCSQAILLSRNAAINDSIGVSGGITGQ